MYFSEPRAHAVSLFITSNILPINILYVETVSSLNLNQTSFARFGAKLWNSYRDKFRQLPKSPVKKHVLDLLLLIMEAEDNYIETPNLLYKSATFE